MLSVVEEEPITFKRTFTLIQGITTLSLGESLSGVAGISVARASIT